MSDISDMMYEQGYHDGYMLALSELNGKKFEKVTRCKDCKHRPTKDLELEQILEFPDGVCPCQNPDDDYYSWYPADDWYCACGEPEDGDSK